MPPLPFRCVFVRADRNSQAHCLQQAGTATLTELYQGQGIVKYASDCEGGSNTCARKLVRLDGKSRETGQEHAGSRLLIGSWRRHSMYCPMCGKETPDGAIFCPACGAKLTSGKMERNPNLQKDGKWKTEPNEGRRTVEPKVQTPRSPKKQAASYFLLYIIIIYCGLVFANMEGWISLPHISFPGSGSNPSVPSVAKTVPSVAKTVPSVAKTVPSVAKTVPSVAKTVPSVAKTVPSVAKTVPSVAKTVPSVAKTVPSVAKTVPSVAKTVPSVAKTVPSAAKQSYLQGIQYMNSSSYSKALES